METFSASGLPLFFLMAPVFWVLVTGLFALMTGHPRLLSRFPPVDEPHSYATAFGSGWGPWLLNASNALTIRVGERGLHFAFNGLFRPLWWWGIPCIPWSEVRYHGLEKRLFTTAHVISFPAVNVRWRIYGAAGAAIADALQARGRSQHPS